LYDLLLRIDPSPVVKLNRAVAIAMRDGPVAGLSRIEGLLAKGELDDYPLAHSAKAELCRRAGRMDEARASFEKALALTSQEQQRRFLQKRLAAIK
jgi:RNA polymerase sigma-70 factor, ECF subfamily